MGETRRMVLGLALLPAVLAGFPVRASSPAAAQGVPFDCSAVAAAAAATPATVAATPAAPAAAFPDGGGELTVFAAASLTDAFGAIAEDLETANPDLAITYNFAGSQALVTQLEQGAEADVFASANTAQMRAAQEDGTIAGEPVTFARNRLAVVVPMANPAGVDDPADLGAEGLKLVLALPEVPVGRYARESVCLMARDPAYGEGFAERVAANVVSEEEDVRDVLAKVELGEADAGVVYVSDALAAGEAATTVAIPEAANRVAEYPIAAVEGGDAALAEAFVAYVLGPDGQATLAEYGFEPVP